MARCGQASSEETSVKYLNFKSGMLVDRPTDTNLQVLPDENTTEICDICKSSHKDQTKFGHFFRTTYAKCHYFCLLLTTPMTQTLKGDKRGILGFSRSDILNARAVISSRECHYCGSKSANIECASDSCNRRYHLVCGHSNNCQFDFFDFSSYCHEHVTLRKPDDWPITEIEASACLICFAELETYNPIDHIIPNCCQNGWLHRQCLQKYADSAGYTLHCPCCNDEDKQSFRRAVRRHGIFVWDREAAWEFEGRYDDITKAKCGANVCKTPKDKNNILTCFACGLKLGHVVCFNVTEKEACSYTCEKCFEQSFLTLYPVLMDDD